MKFWDRERELNVLGQALNQTRLGKSNFIIVIGRRGVGKTRLIYEFIRKAEVKSVYFFVEKKGMESLLNTFTDRLERAIGKRIIRPKTFRDFLLLLKELSREDTLIVVFDEFQNFSNVDGGVLADFQEFIDFLKFEEDSRLMVIFIGSLIGMMHDIFNDKKSPLYGRKTLELFIKPFEYWEIHGLLDKLGVKDCAERVMIYSVLGGSPRYYDVLDRLGINFDLPSVVKALIGKSYVLWKAVRDELIEEFKEAHITYFSILEAIARGNSKANEIANYVGMPEKSLYKYLNELISSFELVEKRIPALAPPHYRGAVYRIKDPFYRFWFRYVFPNQDLIEMEREEDLLREILGDLPNHTSFIFEDIIRRTLLKISGSKIEGVEIPLVKKVGNWWDRKGNEIDIVGYSGKKILFVGEIKWREKPFNFSDLEKFLLKAEKLMTDRSLLILVSRSGFSKAVKSYIEERGGVLIDMESLCRMWDLLSKHEDIV